MSHHTHDSSGVKQAEHLNIDQISDIIQVLDVMIYQYNMTQSHVVYVSPNAEEVVGIPADEIMKMEFFHDIFTHFHPDDQAMVSKVVNEMLADPGELQTLTFRKRNLDGSYDWVHERVRCTIDQETGDSIITGAIRNITNERKNEEVIAELTRRINEPCK